ncbi:IMPACT family protein [Kaistia adipata]|uniref:IMPACT family protein n=1 Tax=Kaistia adipata TaxID=166954 RepID=UPI0003FB1E8D|nr:YigZ family protein [Kaistia adipata]
MFTLKGIESHAQEIKKSRFQAVAGPVSDEAAAKAFIAAHSDPAANHNCWAWRIGQHYRFQDDGEPSGTAGKPILQAIDGQQLDGVAVVVTRWFGGILLGSGGLVRAYGGTAAACLRAAEALPLIATEEATITVPFGDLALVQARLATLPSTQILAQRYGETGSDIVVAIHRTEVDAVEALVADLTSGRAVMARPKTA